MSGKPSKISPTVSPARLMSNAVLVPFGDVKSNPIPFKAFLPNGFDAAPMKFALNVDQKSLASSVLKMTSLLNTI